MTQKIFLSGGKNFSFFEGRRVFAEGIEATLTISKENIPEEVRRSNIKIAENPILQKKHQQLEKLRKSMQKQFEIDKKVLSDDQFTHKYKISKRDKFNGDAFVNWRSKIVDSKNAEIAKNRKENNAAGKAEVKQYGEKVANLRNAIANRRSEIKGANLTGRKNIFRNIVLASFAPQGISPKAAASHGKFAQEYIEFFLAKIKGNTVQYDKDFCTNRKGGKSKVIQIAYENIFFDDMPEGATGDFYVPEYINTEKTKIRATPSNLRGVLKNCKENDIITMIGGEYEGPFFSAIKGVTLQAEKPSNPPKITYKSEKANVQNINKKDTGRENIVDAGSALTLTGENSKISGLLFNTPSVFTSLKLKGNNSIAENCVFQNVVTGIHSEGVGNNLINNSITQYSKDGILYGLYDKKSGGIIEKNRVGDFNGDATSSHNDGIQFYVAKLNEDGSIDYKSRFTGENKAETVTVRNNTVYGEQGMTMFDAQVRNPIVQNNTVYVRNPIHGITLSGVENKSKISGNKIYLNGQKTNLSKVNYIKAAIKPQQQERAAPAETTDIPPPTKTKYEVEIDENNLPF